MANGGKGSEAGVGAMGGLLPKARKRLSAVSDPNAPRPLPKPVTVSRQVFLTPEKWAELARAAEVHTATFAALGIKQTVSRNDIISTFIEWALQAYWKDVGGNPSDEDWDQVIQQYADKLKKVLPK